MGLRLMTTKHCGMCRETKDIKDFHRNVQGRHGRAARCKTCACAASREHARSNREARRQYMERWHDANRGRRFGCGPETYKMLVEEAQGKCAICGKTPRDRLVVDHDHVTGAVRQLLCRKCNAAIGSLNDDPRLLERAARYLRAHQENPRKPLDAPRSVVVRERGRLVECFKGHRIAGENESRSGGCRSCKCSRSAAYKARQLGKYVDAQTYADAKYLELTGLEPNLSAKGRTARTETPA